jgi:hypothetical protein
MKTIYTFALLCLFSSAVLAQEISLNKKTYGNHGRKFLVGLDTEVFGIGSIPYIVFNGGKRDFIPINLALGLYFEVPLSRKWNFRLSAQRYTAQKIANQIEVNSLRSFDEKNPNFSRDVYRVHAAFRKYKTISPFGYFFELRGGFQTMRGGELNMAEFASTENTVVTITNINTFDFGLGFGRNTRLSKKFFLTTSMHFNFIGFVRKNLAEFDGVFATPRIDSSLPYEDQVRINLRHILQSQQSISVKFDLGYSM